MEKSAYKTKQNEALLDYLRTVPGKHVTVGDICSHFEACGTPIGTATVYRRLERMVDAGIVNKYTLDPGSPACFEYVPADAHGCGDCYHCKCEACGKLIHLHCDEVREIGAHLRTHHAFVLDPRRTVFYGLCADCAAQRDADEHQPETEDGSWHS